MGKVDSNRPIQLNSIDKIFKDKEATEIRTGLLDGFSSDNQVTYLLTHIKDDSTVAVQCDQDGHLRWTIGETQVTLGSSWWKRFKHNWNMKFSATYKTEFEAKLDPKIALITGAYNRYMLGKAEAAEQIRLAQDTKEQRITGLETEIRAGEGDLDILREDLANVNILLDRAEALKIQLQDLRDGYLPKAICEEHLAALEKVINTYSSIWFLLSSDEEKVVKAGEDLIGVPLRTAPEREAKQKELQEEIRSIQELDTQIESCNQMIAQYGTDIATLTAQVSDKETAVNELKAALQGENVDVIPQTNLFIPLADDFTSVRASIKEFTKSNFENEMSETQIKVLNRRIQKAIRNDDAYKAIKADATAGNLEPLSIKLAEISGKLIVSSKSVWAPELELRSDRDYLIYNAIRGNLPCFKQVKNDSALIATVIWDADLVVLGEARTLVQNLLSDMNRQLTSPGLTPSEEFHLEMIMGDLLALYPYLRPQDGEVLQLPAKIDGVWTLVDYTTNRIEMSSSLLSSPLVAYGLSPSNQSAPPVLLFKGTTYPTDEGALMSFATDINPFGAVGDYGFRMGRKKIKAWLASQTSEAKVNVYGKSLGGAQSWRTAINFPDKIGKVMAYGAPGFAPLELHKLNKVTKQYPDLQFNFFCQRNDLVHFSDFVAKEGVNYYEVLSGECQNNSLAAHVDMYSTQESSMVLQMQPDAIQSPGKRAAVTIARLIASVLFPVVSVVVLINAIGRTTAFIGGETVRLIGSIGADPVIEENAIQ